MHFKFYAYSDTPFLVSVILLLSFGRKEPVIFASLLLYMQLYIWNKNINLFSVQINKFTAVEYYFGYQMKKQFTPSLFFPVGGREFSRLDQEFDLIFSASIIYPISGPKTTTTTLIIF